MEQAVLIYTVENTKN